jgi:hypothetical protein
MTVPTGWVSQRILITSICLVYEDENIFKQNYLVGVGWVRGV